MFCALTNECPAFMQLLVQFALYQQQYLTERHFWGGLIRQASICALPRHKRLPSLAALALLALAYFFVVFLDEDPLNVL